MMIQVYAVLHDDKVVFWDLHRFRVASYLIPKANPLNDDHPLENKQWINLVNKIDALQVSQSLNHGEHTIILEEIEDDVFINLMRKDIDESLDAAEKAVVR